MDVVGDRLADRVTTILGLGQLLLEEAYGDLSPRQKRVLEELLKAAGDVRVIVLEKAQRYVAD